MKDGNVHNTFVCEIEWEEIEKIGRMEIWKI